MNGIRVYSSILRIPPEIAFSLVIQRGGTRYKRHEIDMTNAMKTCNWPTQTINHLLALGHVLGLLGFALDT